jgi:hypothetical protein
MSEIVYTIAECAARTGDLDYAEQVLWLQGKKPSLLLMAQLREQLEYAIGQAAERGVTEGESSGYENGFTEGMERADEHAGEIADRHRIALQNALQKVQTVMETALYSRKPLPPEAGPVCLQGLLGFRMVIDELAKYDDVLAAYRKEKNL